MGNVAHRPYQDRPLSEGYPGLEQLGVEWFKAHQPADTGIVEILECLERLVDLSSGLRTVTVVGCGPRPASPRELLARGYDAVGIEAVAGSAEAAAEYMGNPDHVRLGSAESVGLPDESQRVVLMESVLEHVDSPAKALAESYRILVPGGVLYVHTTNRHRFSLYRPQR